MLDIVLRKMKEKDVQNVGRCLAYKIVPFECLKQKQSPKQFVQSCLDYDMKSKIILAIADKATDELIGCIHAFQEENVYVIWIYIIPCFCNQGIGTKALESFKTYISFNFPSTKSLHLYSNYLNIPAMKIAKKTGFKIVLQNNYVMKWELQLH